MQIAVAQIRPDKGAVKPNLQKHIQLIKLAKKEAADAIFFPELSITGYEPEIVQKLNFSIDDVLFSEIKTIAKNQNILVGIGAPIRSESAPLIGQIIFRTDGSVCHYAKRHLHPDEIPFFEVGKESPIVPFQNLNIGLAICYEISVDVHIDDLFNQNVQVILAPVAKSLDGTYAAHLRLAEIAKKYSAPVLLANCVGPSDDFIAAGQSAVWRSNGDLVNCLNAEQEGAIIFDTLKEDCIQIIT